MDGSGARCLYLTLPESTWREVSWYLERLTHEPGEGLRPQGRNQRLSVGPRPTLTVLHTLFPRPGQVLCPLIPRYLPSLSPPPFLQENVLLIKEINELRRELKLTRSQVYDLEAALKLTKKTQPQDVTEKGNSPRGPERWASGPGTSGSHEQVWLWLPKLPLLSFLL